MVVVGNITNAHPYKQYAAAEQTPITADITLEKDEIYNLIEFIEIEFINSVRNDENIDNIDYIISMMNALQKLRLAYASIKLDEESAKIIQEESK
jgi:hypothetical protein